MPAAPEFRNRLGCIGQIKVLAVLESKDHTKANGHVGITAEVKIQLEGKHESRKPRANKHGIRTQIRQSVDNLTAIVSNQDLLRKANRKTLDTLENHTGNHPACMQLNLHLLIADNGAHQQLWIHQPTQQHAVEVFLNLDSTHIYVGKIGNHGENVEGDTDGQDSSGVLDGEADGIQRVNYRPIKTHQHTMFHHDADHTQEKVQIFKNTKHEQINCDWYRDAPFVTLANAQTQPIVHIGNADHKEQIQRLTHGVEQHADSQQRNVLQMHTGHQKVHSHCQRKQYKQIIQIGIFHYRTSHQITKIRIITIIVIIPNPATLFNIIFAKENSEEQALRSLNI